MVGAGYRGRRGAHARKHCGAPHARRDGRAHNGSTRGKPRARDVLRDWARAPGYSNRAAEFLELARCAALPAVRKRYLKIAGHYRTLAEIERRVQITKSSNNSASAFRTQVGCSAETQISISDAAKSIAHGQVVAPLPEEKKPAAHFVTPSTSKRILGRDAKRNLVTVEAATPSVRSASVKKNRDVGNRTKT